eukprot:gene2774-3779_t
MMLTRGLTPSARALRSGIFFGPYSFHSQAMARSALCHWSSSMVRGRKRLMLVPSGVTPPPIISAIEPVTTSAGVDYSSKLDDAKSIKDSQAHSSAITQLAASRSRKEHKQSFRVSAVAGAREST